MFTADDYLARLVKNTKVTTNDFSIQRQTEIPSEFAIYLETHNGSVHRYQEGGNILFLESGEVSLKFHGQVLNLTAGNLVLINAGTEFEVYNQTAKTVLVKLKFKPTFSLQAWLTSLQANSAEEVAISERILTSLQTQGYLCITTTRAMQAPQVMMTLINEYLNSDVFSLSLCQNLLSFILISAIRAQRFTNPTQVVQAKFDLATLEQFIDSNFADITLKKAADYFGFNSNYFSNLVKKTTGRSFVEHVDDRRMQEAKTLLAQPNLSLQEIIARVGYASKSFFYKKFSQYYGQTPAKMREELFRQQHIDLN